MAILTKQALQAKITSLLAFNESGDITDADMRELLGDLADTLFSNATEPVVDAGPAALTGPTPESTLSGTSGVVLSWSAGEDAPGYRQYQLTIGSSAGDDSIADSGALAVTTYTANGLPSDASTVHVRLAWSDDGWSTAEYADYTYTAYLIGAPALTSPTPSSTLTGSSDVEFTWSAGTNAPAGRRFMLEIGESAGEVDYHDGSATDQTSDTVVSLPFGGQTLYVRLSWSDDDWLTTEHEDYTLTAFTAQAPSAALNTLINGTFDYQVQGWSALNGAVLTEVGGMLRLESGEANWGNAFQSVEVEIGETYKISFEATEGNTGTPKISLGNTASLTQYGENLSPGTHEITIADEAKLDIYLQSGGDTIGDYSLFDNVRLVKVVSAASFYPPEFELQNLEAVADPDVTEPAAKATSIETPSYLDPVSGTKVFRATIPSDFPSGTFVRHEYSRRQAFNCDNTRYIAQASNGFWLLYDANTFQVLPRGRANGALLGMAGDCEAFWDATDPAKLIYTGNNGGLVYWEKDVETDTDTVAFDFTGRLPGGWSGTTAMWTKSEGTPSADGRYMAFMATSYNSGSQSNVIHGLVCYDRQTDTIVGTLDASAFSGNFPDHISMSPSGDFVVPSWAFTPALGTRVYNRDFSSYTIILDESEHSDLALNALGQDILVAADYGQDNIIAYNLHTDETWNIMGLYPRAGANIGAIHISGKCFEQPGWVLISTYADSSDYTSTYPDSELEPGQRALFLVELLPESFRMLFVCHTRAAEDYGGYFGEHQATISRDGTRAMFATNFNDGGVSSDYMVLLPDFTDDGSAWGAGGGGGGPEETNLTAPSYDGAFALPAVAAVAEGALTQPAAKSDSIEAGDESYTDAVSGVKVYRVTAPGDYAGGVVTHDRSDIQLFNADSTRFIAKGADGLWVLYNATTFERLDRGGANGALNLTHSTVPIWHPTDPDKLYFTNEGGGLVWSVKTISTGSDEVFLDFGSITLPWAGATKVWGGLTTEPDAAGRYWAFHVANGSTSLGIICYDTNTDTIVGSLAAASYGNAAPSTVRMTPSGTRVLVDWASARGIRTYALDMSDEITAYAATAYEWDVALNAAGTGDVLVYLDGSSTYDLMGMALPSGTPFTVVDISPAGGASVGFPMVSGGAYGQPGYALVSLSGDSSDYGGTEPDPTTRAGQRSIMLVELVDGGEKLMVGHSRVGANSTKAPEPVISRDGTRVLFMSDFDTGGSVDEYMMLLPNFSS